jgi:hypothetical protein
VSRDSLLQGAVVQVRPQKDGGSTVIEYYDFGLPVSITSPPSEAIITFEELFKEVEAHQTDSNCEGDQSSSDGSSDNDQLTLPENPGTSPAEAPTLLPSGSVTYYVCSTIGGG